MTVFFCYHLYFLKDKITKSLEKFFNLFIYLKLKGQIIFRQDFLYNSHYFNYNQDKLLKDYTK